MSETQVDVVEQVITFNGGRNEREKGERPRRAPVPSWVITVAGVVVFLALWQLLGRHVNPMFGSYPTAIVAAGIDLARSGKLVSALSESIQPFLLGYLLAILLVFRLG